MPKRYAVVTGVFSPPPERSNTHGMRPVSALPSHAELEPIHGHLAPKLEALRTACVHPDDPPFLQDVEAVFSGDQLDLPQLPEDLARVRLVLADPDAGPRELAEAIRPNPVVSARFLAAGTSAYYAGRHPPQTLEDAIARVGMRQAVAWVMAIVSQSTIFNPLGYRFEAKQIFRHSLATSINARLLAEMSADHLALDAFLGGLIHDFGRVHLLALAGGHDGTGPERGAPSRSFLDRLSDETHAELSGLLAQHWKLSSPLISAVLDHHLVSPEPAEDDPDELILTRLLHAGDQLAHRMIDSMEIQEDQEVDAQTIDLVGSYEVLERVVEEARQAYEALETALGDD